MRHRRGPGDCRELVEPTIVGVTSVRNGCFLSRSEDRQLRYVNSTYGAPVNYWFKLC